MSRSRFSLSAVRRPGPLVALSLTYLLLVSGVMIWRGISVSPDYLLLILVPVALLSGRFVRFLRDWVPFIALFLGYEALRGISRKSGVSVRYEDVIRAGRAMFGGTDPTQWLQAHLTWTQRSRARWGSPGRRHHRGLAEEALPPPSPRAPR